MLEHTIGNSEPPAYGRRGLRDSLAVLDLAVSSAGRCAAMHLGEFGARVVRVIEPSDARRTRSGATRTAPSTWCRRGDGLVAELASTSRRRRRRPAGTRLELPGSTCDQLRRDNPAAGPCRGCRRTRRAGETADLPYDELLLWAWTGLAAQQPGATSDHPVASVVPIITYEQGALGACAIAAALVERATRGTVALVHGVGPARGRTR